METLKDLMIQLNSTDECTAIEAKKASEIGKSILETVCAYSNEPNLGGGYLLLGVERDESSLFPEYSVTGLPTNRMDQIQTDLASQCATLFNIPIRPNIIIETINHKNVIVVFVDELAAEQKPLYFKNKGLPQGAYRRIGAADYKCTEDDLSIFYQRTETLDGAVIIDAELEDLSEVSIDIYRKFRAAVNPAAEELEYNNEELLRSINAIKKEKREIKVTYTGLLTFGSKMALRRILPMMRVDYIRVATNDWIENADARFISTLDMRGSLLELVQRIIYTISDDLPKGFELTDENIQAKNMGLPLRVLREAVVNALIHRSYRENSPIQIIRYPNRIEIINPGFSLKTEEQLGEPGSVNRNPFISAIFHETNLAETKGSGIRTMRRLMEGVSMMPPTFESDRENNKFTVRLLLHHLLNEQDILWLRNFDSFNLSDNQKRILIFIRELGAVDNSSARQINGVEASISNIELRKLKELGLIETKGKNKFAYYIPSEMLSNTYVEGIALIENKANIPSGLPTNLNALPTNLNALPTNLDMLPTKFERLTTKLSKLSANEVKTLLAIQEKIEKLPQRIADKGILINIILELCEINSFKLNELALILDKNEKYLYQEYIKPLLIDKKLNYKYPDMINHPDQAYHTVKNLSDNTTNR